MRSIAFVWRSVVYLALGLSFLILTNELDYGTHAFHSHLLPNSAAYLHPLLRHCRYSSISRFPVCSDQASVAFPSEHAAIGRTSLIHKKSPSLRNPSVSLLGSVHTAQSKVGQTPLKSDPVHDYVTKHGGVRPIRRILIANNGMAAVKCILSIRQWTFNEFNDDKAIEFVVMASPEDLTANAEFIRIADKIVEVPGGSNRNNYANVDLITSIAKVENVDAVWPGWGHASENPALPKRLAELNINFIGPTSSVMSALGDKIAANILAQTAGVPSIPWSGEGLVSDIDKHGQISPAVFKKATISSVEECIQQANKIGFPIMIKASEGGGGKGIRLVDEARHVRTAYEQVINEVKGSPVFLMQLCKNARHIEVQIMGDQYGNAVAVSGRDCTTQRRFQKIFEEGPPTTIVPPETFE